MKVSFKASVPLSVDSRTGVEQIGKIITRSQKNDAHLFLVSFVSVKT